MGSAGHDGLSYQRGLRAAVTWLHQRALEMNDPHARTVLNMAAFDLGLQKAGLVFVQPDSEPADVPHRGITSVDTREAKNLPSQDPT